MAPSPDPQADPRVNGADSGHVVAPVGYRSRGTQHVFRQLRGAALAGRVRGRGAPGRPRDRRAGRLRRPLHRTRGERRDPLPQLRVRKGLPAHVPGSDPGGLGVLGSGRRYGAEGRARSHRTTLRNPPRPRSRLRPRPPTITPTTTSRRPQRHQRGERRAASRIHDGLHRHGGRRLARSRPGARSVPPRRVGEAEVSAVEEAVRRIRLLDDRHGADGLTSGRAAPADRVRPARRGCGPRAPPHERLHTGRG